MDRVEQYVATYAPDIYHDFFDGPLSKGFGCEIQAMPNESHCRGACPCTIDFVDGDSLLGRVVLKPRWAEVDQAIFSLFARLNDVSDRSIDATLGICKIRNYGAEEFSVWEYIPGKSGDGSAASGLLRGACMGELHRLDQIASHIGLSDLHSANIVFSPIDRCSSFVAVDLESLQPGCSTGLFAYRPVSTPLTDEELGLIDQAEIGRLPHRAMPVATGKFLGGLSSYSSAEGLTRKVIEGIGGRYETLMRDDDLRDLIFQDLLNGDVPYFVESGATIYYTLSSMNLPLAKERQ